MKRIGLLFLIGSAAISVPACGVRYTDALIVELALDHIEEYPLNAKFLEDFSASHRAKVTSDSVIIADGDRIVHIFNRDSEHRANSCIKVNVTGLRLEDMQKYADELQKKAASVVFAFKLGFISGATGGVFGVLFSLYAWNKWFNRK